MDETTMWLIGLAVTAGIAFLGIWWHVEAKQDRALCSLRKERAADAIKNDKSHQIIHEKVDDVRDKIEAIWIHLLKEAKRKR